MYSTYSVCVCVWWVEGHVQYMQCVCVCGGWRDMYSTCSVCVWGGVGTCTGLASVPGQFFMEKVGPGAEVRVLTSYK